MAKAASFAKSKSYPDSIRAQRRLVTGRGNVLAVAAGIAERARWGELENAIRERCQEMAIVRDEEHRAGEVFEGTGRAGKRSTWKASVV